MTTENKEELLRLYKLLWEQIKYETGLSEGLCYYSVVVMFKRKMIITELESDKLCAHIQSKMPVRRISIAPTYTEGYISAYGWDEEDDEGRKSFVQRMITELEN